MEPTDRLTVALWAVNLAVPLNGLDAWAARIDAKMAEAAAAGADLLALPEYAAEQWLSFAPESLAPSDEIPWMADQADRAAALVRPLAARHGLALLAGTMPVHAPDKSPPFLNRALLFLPDGREIQQDKLCLTPSERDPAGWNLATGERVEIVEWRGLRLATLVCLDVELPALANRLAPENLDLLLVPSMTEKRAGHARVFGCAKARAVELQAAVCAVGCIGAAATGRPRHGNVSGAAAYLPCEEVLGHVGIAAEIPPAEAVEGDGPLLIARDLPLGLIRELRAGRAEVWPGAWSGDQVTIARHEESGP